MSMQITVDPSGMTQAQREAVAGFILAYPAGKSVGTLSVDVTADTSKLQAAIKQVQSAPIAPNDVPNVGALTPVEVFGAIDTPTAAFGQVHAVTPPGIGGHPLPSGLPAAPCIAGVNPSSTVHEAMPGTISTGQAPAAPAPPAPTQGNAAVPAAPLTANHAPSVELDTTGLPWNAKIHAESKAKIADGTWRKKRNLDPALLATVEAELRQLMSAPAPAAPNSALIPGAPGFTHSTAPLTVGAAITGHPAGPLTVTATSAPPAEVSADARQQFVSLVGRTAAAIQGGKVTQAEITQVCVNAGVPALPLLGNRLDLVASIAQQIDMLIAAR